MQTACPSSSIELIITVTYTKYLKEMILIPLNTTLIFGLRITNKIYQELLAFITEIKHLSEIELNTEIFCGEQFEDPALQQLRLKTKNMKKIE